METRDYRKLLYRENILHRGSWDVFTRLMGLGRRHSLPRLLSVFTSDPWSSLRVDERGSTQCLVDRLARGGSGQRRASVQIGRQDGGDVGTVLGMTSEVGLERSTWVSTALLYCPAVSGPSLDPGSRGVEGTRYDRQSL